MKELLAQLRAAPLWVKALLLAVVLVVVVGAIAAATSRPKQKKIAAHQATTTTKEQDETETLPPGTLPPTTLVPATAVLDSPTSSTAGCRTGDPLANVYHPYRLQVIKPCTTVTGVVETVRHEPDGDYHFDVALDPGYAALVNQGNAEYQHGYLVAEIVPADEAGCTPGQPPRPPSGTYDYGICTGSDVPVPAVGAHVSITGPYVIDDVHNWAEIHPVWSVGPASGGTVPATAVGSAAPAPSPTSPPSSGNCDPSYPDFCIPPPPPDLDCKDVAPHHNFTVLPPDPHHFDADHNGRGCET